jgi:hypothetical protein
VKHVSSRREFLHNVERPRRQLLPTVRTAIEALHHREVGDAEFEVWLAIEGNLALRTNAAGA